MLTVYGKPAPREGAQLGVVYFPPAGSRVSQDGGRDAHFLARALETAGLRAPVIAVDRPGASRRLPSPSFRTYMGRGNAFNGYGGELDHYLFRALTRLGGWGVKHVLFTGRSAGGEIALAATLAAERLASQKGNHLPRPAGTQVFEPAAWQKQPGETQREQVARGKQHVEAYQREQARHLAIDDLFPEQKLVHPEPHGLTGFDRLTRSLSIKSWGPVDQYHNQLLWVSDMARQSAERIAGEMPHVELGVEFAKFSLVTDSVNLHESAEVLYRARFARLDGLDPAAVAPLVVDQSEGTVHASYDNRDYYFDRFVPTFQSVSERILAA